MTESIFELKGLLAANDIPEIRVDVAKLAQAVVHLTDYSKLSNEQLWNRYFVDEMIWEAVRFDSGWEKFEYPEQSLPPKVINGVLSSSIPLVYSSDPDDRYFSVIVCCYQWALVDQELRRRREQHRELDAMLAYGCTVGAFPTWTDFLLLHGLLGNKYPYPKSLDGSERDETFRNLLESLEFLKITGFSVDKLNRVLLPSEEAKLSPKSWNEYKKRTTHIQRATGIWAGASNWLKMTKGDLGKAVIEGLKGKIPHYLSLAAKREIINEWREQDPEFARAYKLMVKRAGHGIPKWDLRDWLRQFWATSNRDEMDIAMIGGPNAEALRTVSRIFGPEFEAMRHMPLPYDAPLPVEDSFRPTKEDEHVSGQYSDFLTENNLLWLPASADIPEPAGLVITLNQLVEKLPEKQRRVVGLFREGYTDRQAVQIMEYEFHKPTTEANIRKLRSRAMGTLKKMVEE